MCTGVFRCGWCGCSRVDLECLLGSQSGFVLCEGSDSACLRKLVEGPCIVHAAADTCMYYKYVKH